MNMMIDISAAERAAYEAQAMAEGLSVQEWLKKLANEQVVCRLPPLRADNLADLLLDSPFAGSELDLERVRDFPRPVDLG